MIADLKPYPENKESGLPWVGHVPGHWTVETLRRFLRSGDGIKIGPFGSQLKLAHMSESGFKVYGQANVISGDIRRGSKFVDEAKFEQLRECEVSPGDLLVTMMGTSGRCMVVPEDAVAGLMDSHLLRLRLRPNGVGPAFTALAIDQAPYVKQQVEVAGKGSIMQGLNSGMVKNLVLLIPPPDEQAAIVRFLDWANGRLERAIRAKRRVIAMLNEQKQAIIHRAVTRGLDPAVPLKPSGIPWLGDIPQHWESAIKMKYISSLKGRLGWQGLQAREYLDHGPAVVSSAHFRNQKINWDKCPHVSQERYEMDANIQLAVGDILLMKDGAAMGKLAFVGELPTPACLNSHLLLFRPLAANGGPKYDPKFMFYFMLTSVFQDYVQVNGTGATFLGVSQDALGHYKICLPSIVEQRAIVRFLDGATGLQDEAIALVDQEITLLREYRTGLVADVVTGKLDVREAAARLPDEAPPDTVEEDADLGNETEAADEEAPV